MAFHHNATYMLPSLTFPFHFFYSYECVPLTIFYHLYFRRISYILSMLHQGSVERIQSKECYFKFTHTFLAFFIVFHQKICVFIIFISSFFWWSIEAPQQNINQTETGRFCQGNCICTKPASGCKEIITTNLQQIFLGNFCVRYQHSERIRFECGFRKYY